LHFKKVLWQGLPWFIIAIGLFLRLDQYLFNRSLWLDEAFLATHLVQGNWLTLITEPLEYGHIVPAGFVLAVKLSITLFGNSDFVLRLFPFLCGSASLFLFYYLAKRAISPSAVPIALFLFAIADSLIFYTSEFKPYSVDVLVTLTLLAVVYTTQDKQLSTKSLILLIILGVITPWLSYIAIIILATMGSYLGYVSFINKQWQQLLKLTGIGFIWVGNFLWLYLFVIGGDANTLPTGHWITTAWSSYGAFMPSTSVKESIIWIYDTFNKTLDYPGNFNAVELGWILWLVGISALFFQHKKTFFLTLTPILLTLFASYLHKYPFFGRMILFLVPLFYLIIAEGITHLHIDVTQNLKITALINISVLFFALALLINVSLLVEHAIVRQQRVVEEIKPVLHYIQHHHQPDEAIYLYFWAEPAFRYYADFYGFDAHDCHLISPIPPKDYIKEVDYFRISQQLQPVPVQQTPCILGVSELFFQAQPDLAQLQGKVWFIFTHIDEREKPKFLAYLDSNGDKLAEIEVAGASGYLYALRH
jgi:hypothetical protein